jgi:sugar O-acyltransferase (sialic acid O-acetyltransferase NeuD family)
VNKNIIIYGFGGFSNELACLLIDLDYNIIGFVDDDLSKLNSYNSFGKVIGDYKFLNNYNQKISVVFAISNPQVVKSIYSKLNNINLSFPNIIAPNVRILFNNELKIGYGNVVMYDCLLSYKVEIGNFNILNFGISIGHDTKVGSFNSFMSYTKISGEVKIGNLNYFGACSVVLQQKIVGNDTIIGTNSVVMRNTEDSNTYLGNPAVKILKPK